MKKIKLCIAGELFDVLFDGKKVTSPEFPNMELEYTACCGARVTQKLLVDICHNKVEKLGL